MIGTRCAISPEIQSGHRVNVTRWQSQLRHHHGWRHPRGLRQRLAEYRLAFRGAGCPFVRERKTMGIIDRREIEFDEQSLIGVIAAFWDRAETIGVPAIRPSKIGFTPEANHIRIEYEARPEVRLSVDHLASLLVSYCVRAGIPIPRQSAKELRVGSSSVVLAFTTLVFVKTQTELRVPRRPK